VYFTDIVFHTHTLHSLTLYDSKSEFTLIRYIDQTLVRSTLRTAVDTRYYALRIARNLYLYRCTVHFVVYLSNTPTDAHI